MQMRTELWMSQLHSQDGRGSYAVARFSELVNEQLEESVLAEIEKDTHRTFPGHATLSSDIGHRAMLKVLRAYAASDPEVGYSQGMNFLAGLFLTYLSPPEAFGALTVVMHDRNLRNMYKPNGMTYLQARLWQLSALLPRDLAEHLERHMVLPVLYASSWLLTCFASEFPIKFAARVMDVVLTNSYELAMMRVSLQIMIRCKDDIMLMEDMETIVDLIRKEVPKWPENVLQDLLTEALGTPWSQQQWEVLHKIDDTETVSEAVLRAEATYSAEKSEDSKPISRLTTAASHSNPASLENIRHDVPATSKASADDDGTDSIGDLISIHPSSTMSFSSQLHGSQEWSAEWQSPAVEVHGTPTERQRKQKEEGHEFDDPFNSLYSQERRASPFAFQPLMQESSKSMGGAPSLIDQPVPPESVSQANDCSLSYQSSMKHLLSKMTLEDGSGQLPDQLRDWIMSTSVNWGTNSPESSQKNTPASNTPSPRFQEEEKSNFGHAGS